MILFGFQYLLEYLVFDPISQILFPVSQIPSFSSYLAPMSHYPPVSPCLLSKESILSFRVILC
jgi:hypothetical protein